MSEISDYLKNKVLLDNLIDQQCYVALLDGDTEVSQSDYMRQPIVFDTPVSGQVSNNKDILFDVSLSHWGTVNHVAIYDALADGNLLFKSESEFEKEIDISSQYRIPKNYLIVRLT